MFYEGWMQSLRRSDHARELNVRAKGGASVSAGFASSWDWSTELGRGHGRYVLWLQALLLLLLADGACRW